MAGAMPFAASLLAQTKKVPVGLELYSVRGELKKDPKATVTAVAKMGYEVVEFYSPYLSWTVDEAKDYRKLLDDLGIKCLSTHNGAQALSAENLSKTVELNQIIGSKAIIVASAPGKIADVDGWKAFAATLAAAADKLRPQGMSTGFHNHQIEWQPVGDTRPMDSRRARRKTWSCSSTAGPPSKSASIPSRGSRPIPDASRASTSRTGAKAKAAATLWRSAKATCSGSRYLPRPKRSGAPSTT